MNFMQCNCCRGIVNVNATGICYGCQRQTGGILQEDKYIEEKQVLSNLLERERKIEDAIQKQESESLDVCHKAKDGKRVGKRDSKGKIAPKKSKKEKD